jgi:pyruvate,water dikinase
MAYKFTVDLRDIKMEDLNLVGGKNASLGEMLQHLSQLQITIPAGFAITAEAYWAFLQLNKLENSIYRIIDEIDMNDLVSLRKGGMRIRQLIRNGKFPRELKDEIIERYRVLSQAYDQVATDVAVRSSATAEDLPDASFAGQQETYLNVRGPEGILEAVRNCFASLFTDRAISYREHFRFDHFDVGLSVCIQKMVRSDLASS